MHLREIKICMGKIYCLAVNGAAMQKTKGHSRSGAVPPRRLVKVGI